MKNPESKQNTSQNTNPKTDNNNKQNNFSPSLENDDITLKKLEDHHLDELSAAAANPEIWTLNPKLRNPDDFKSIWFEPAIAAQESGESMIYVILQTKTQTNGNTKKIIGATRFYEINRAHKRATIGYTWLTPSSWGKGINTRCKFLLFQHAFEDLDFERLAFCIDVRNKRSIAAAKKCGASHEGTLRSHMTLPDMSRRDSMILSIIKPEWPKIKNDIF